jgi:ABC-type uncharacterized transport system auxiliary subunit
LLTANGSTRRRACSRHCIVSALESSGTFRAVILAPTAAAGDLRLDTEILRLQQDFASQPSRVRFTLRAYLVDQHDTAGAGLARIR